MVGTASEASVCVPSSCIGVLSSGSASIPVPNA